MATVILASGAPGTCMHAPTFLMLYSAEPGATRKDMLMTIGLDNPYSVSEYSTHSGYLNVFKVKPGAYFLTTWTQHPFITQVQSPRADLSLSAGEVVYFGEFFLTSACGNSLEIRDQEPRDMALLAKRNPALAKAVTGKRILPLGTYKW